MRYDLRVDAQDVDLLLMILEQEHARCWSRAEKAHATREQHLTDLKRIERMQGSLRIGQRVIENDKHVVLLPND